MFAFLKALGELWKQLTAEEKAPFEKQAAQDKQRYEKEMQSYTPPMRDASNGGDAKPQKKSKAKKVCLLPGSADCPRRNVRNPLQKFPRVLLQSF